MKILKFQLPINLTLMAMVVFLIIPNQSCKQSDAIIEQEYQKFAPEVENAIANIVSIAKKNAKSIAAIYETKQSSPNNGLTLRNGDIDVLDQETENGIRQFEKDPESVLRQIAAESQGAEKIALIEGLFAIKDGQTLKKLYAPFGSIDDMPDYNASYGDGLQLRSCPLDCRLHWMAGASIATGVCAMAYLTLGRFSFWAKVAIAVASGVAMAILAAHAREAYNERQVAGSYSWRDFRNTIYGGSIAAPASAAITWGLLKMGLSRVVTGISMGVVAAILGYCPMATLLTGNAPGSC